MPWLKKICRFGGLGEQGGSRVGEATSYFSVSKGHIYKLIEAERTKVVRIGRCLRMPYSEVERYERKR